MKGWRSVLVLGLAVIGLVACNGESGAGNEPPPVGEPLPPPPPPPPPVTDVGPWALDPVRGEAQFVEKCQRCHGPLGSGGYGPALNNTATCGPCAQFATLWPRIDEFMPLRNPEACDAACSRDIAAWITNGFSTAPSCSVQFSYERIGAQQFTATVRLFNFRGQSVPRWRLGFTLPEGHRISGVVDALLDQSGNQVLLESPAGAGIADGQVVRIGLQGSHAGQAVVPSDLRLEAPPCFTAVAPNVVHTTSL